MSTIFRTLVFASSMTAWAAGEAGATEYQCRKSDSTLRIAIEVKKAGHTLPCDVIAEDDRGERAVLYSARYDRDYCPNRIETTRDELEQEGWTCQKTADENIVTNEDVPSTDARRDVSVLEKRSPVSDEARVAGDGGVIASSHQCRLGNDIRRIHVETESPASGKPCEIIFWADGDQSKPGQLLWRAEHDATFCPRRLNTIVDKWVDEGWRCDADEPQTAALETPTAPSDERASPLEEARTGVESDARPLTADRTLEAIITADAERIGEWMKVEPAIEIAARGDLNDDGNDDAVVFLAYQSDQAAYRQYLMSYLVGDGGGYELASVKLLTDVNPPPAQARVEQIEEGVIWLTLPDKDGALAGKTGYRLRDQQLIEVDETSSSVTSD